VYLKLGKFKEARDECVIVEKAIPATKAGRLQYNLGSIYEAEGLLDEAMERYNLALSLDPKLNFTHFNIARIYLLKNKLYPAAEEILKSLPETSPQASQDERYLKTISVYLRSLKDIRLTPVFYNNLGVQFVSHSFLDAAVASFKRALELDPSYSDAHFNLGLAFWEQGLEKKAISEFRAAVEINPDHLEAKKALAGIIHKK
jgi:tetratricopeptide (TPR) repeat protein